MAPGYPRNRTHTDRIEKIRAHFNVSSVTDGMHWTVYRLMIDALDIISRAESRGLLTLTGQKRTDGEGSTVVSAEVKGGSDTLAGWLSAVLECTAWPTGRGVTLTSGSTVLARILKPEWYLRGLEAEAVAYAVTGEPMPGDAGAVARRLWDRVGPAQFPAPEVLDRITLPGYFYVRSLPGLVGTAYKVDISNCYGTVLAKLPTPYVKVFNSGAVKFQTPDGFDREAWAQLQECSRRSKHIGRCLYGCAISKKPEQRRWYDGERKPSKLPRGSHRIAGEFVARCVHELVWLQSTMVNASWAYTDCIVSPAPAEDLTLWSSAGLSMHTDAVGEADIHGPTIYRVGDYATVPYRVCVMGEPHSNASGMFTLPRPQIVRGDDAPPQLLSAFLIAA